MKLQCVDLTCNEHKGSTVARNLLEDYVNHIGNKWGMKLGREFFIADEDEILNGAVVTDTEGKMNAFGHLKPSSG